MNPEVKAIWIEALKSGNYNKGEGRLYYKERNGKECHCALGVLAEEAGKAGVITIDPTAWGNERFMANEDTPSERLLPKAVIEWAGLGEFSDEEGPVFRLNDNDKTATFEDIAYMIKDKL